MAKLVCTVEMSKEIGSGISVTVVNADAEITQTITMDGTTLTLKVAGKEDTSTLSMTSTTLILKVAGKEDTSTFTQKADSIAIKCKDFSIEAANTITCISQKATKHQSEDTVTIQSTKDMTLTSSAKLVQSADKDLTLDGDNVKATAKTEASLKGTQVNLSGSQVAIKADSQLSAESTGMATLGGSTTTVKGTLINAG